MGARQSLGLALRTQRDLVHQHAGDRVCGGIAYRIPGFSNSRRSFMRASTAAICLTPAAVISFGILTRKNFVVNEVELKFPNLPRDLRSLRIVQEVTSTSALFIPSAIWCT